MSPEQSIIVKKGPKSRKDAVNNMLAFSNETRQSPQEGIADGLIISTPFPPLPSCYGWLRISQDELPRLDPPTRLERYEHLGCHWAIVYEYVPEKEQNLAIGQNHLDFFYTIGFALEAYKPDLARRSPCGSQ